MGMDKSGVNTVRHGAFAMSTCQTPCHFVSQKSLLSRSLLAATYWVRSGRVQVVSALWSVTLSVCTCRCQSLAKVPRFRAVVHAVHGPRWPVSDFWWDLGPTVCITVRSTVHLQQPDWKATALRMVHQASGSAL